MWSYNFELPILLILSMILVFYFSRPRLPVRRNLTFVHLIVIETLTILADLWATMVDNDPHLYSMLTLKVSNMLYFCLFFIRAYIMYAFVASVAMDTFQKKNFLRVMTALPMLAGSVLAVLSATIGSPRFSQVIFYIERDGYHSGSLYRYAIYGIGFGYVLMGYLSLLLFRNNIKRRREIYGILMYNSILCLGLVVRIVFPRLLLMDTFVLIAILIIFLAFGNPDFYLDLSGRAFNRRALREHLEQDHGSLKMMPFGLAIHNFHEMDDIYGRSQIEEGLTVIAKYLKHMFPQAIVFYCRNGRFVVLDRPGTDFDGRLQEMTERFNHPWRSGNAEVYLSACFVTYEYLAGGFDCDVLMETLLKALDTAGSAEPGQPLHITRTDVEIIEQERHVRQAIETALDEESLLLYLQPIIDAGTGTIVGAETLSRIRDAEGSIIPPGVFIPVAEVSGRINALGEMVFEKTCEFIRDVNLDTLGIEWVNVNISPTQFLRTDLADRYSAIAEKYGVDPCKIHLEITEESMIDDGFLQKQIWAMQDKGFVFVLDDYGTGYSNLSRLKKCPFINVKLDMSIVWDYCRQPDEILPNMIRAFKSMGFAVTAEGVEDENVQKIMKEIGCDFLQGYHFSKPLPAEEFIGKYSLKRVGS